MGAAAGFGGSAAVWMGMRSLSARVRGKVQVRRTRTA